jgi:hypothetical protein
MYPMLKPTNKYYCGYYPEHGNYEPVRGYSQRAGKSLFARDCVVGLGGLELLTKRLLPRHE